MTRSPRFRRRALQRYLYWSDRRVRSVLQDVGFIPTDRQRTMTTSAQPLGRFGMTLSSEELRPWTRPELARIIERRVGRDAARCLDGITRIRWAKGAGTIDFNEFMPHSDGRPAERTMMYTSSTAKDGTLIGVCLFGKSESYDAFTVERRPDGWHSSGEPDVLRFLQQRDPEGPFDPEYVALSALTIAHHPASVHREGLTFGDVDHQCEWFAEIYLDFKFSSPITNHSEALDGHSRVLVGAPLWVRTPPTKPSLWHRLRGTKAGRRSFSRPGTPATSSTAAQLATADTRTRSILSSHEPRRVTRGAG